MRVWLEPRPVGCGGCAVGGAVAVCGEGTQLRWPACRPALALPVGQQQQQQQHQQFFTRFHCYISAQTPYLPLTHNTYTFTATVNFYDLTPNNLLILYPTLSLFHTRRECHSVDLIKL